MSQAEWENLASLLSLAVAFVAAGLLWAGLVPRRWIQAAENAFAKLAKARPLCFILIPAVSFVLNIGIVYHREFPRPRKHDEFSYLLAGDTFAHGRLTNPSPKFFEHFETPQEIMRPTRMSKYPPGQGLVIALGQAIAGLPILGIWISTAAACVAIYWMMLGFLPRSWALLGGLMAATSPALLDWSQTYWGGSVAVLGGALLLGGWGRLMLRTTVGASMVGASTIMAIGLAVLANSRPFEGLMTAAPLLVGLLIHARRRLGAMVAPVLIVLGITAGGMGWYNHRVTGHVLELPFAEYTRQYDLYPKFWFQPLRPMPEYRNRSQLWLHTDWEKGVYDQLRTVRGFCRIAVYRIGTLLTDNLTLAALFIPFAISFSLLRDARYRWAMISVAVLLLGLLAENFDLPHYSAPVNATLLLLVVSGLRKVQSDECRVQNEEKKRGDPHNSPRSALCNLHFALTPAILTGFIAGVAMCLAQGIDHDLRFIELVALKPQLQTGNNLVFVDYGPMTEMTGGFANEYVYNSADMNNSPIIWARWFGPDADRPVAREYPGRKVWKLYVGKTLELTPYLEQP
jgi:hypothetical protein